MTYFANRMVSRGGWGFLSIIKPLTKVSMEHALMFECYPVSNTLVLADRPTFVMIGYIGFQYQDIFTLEVRVLVSFLSVQV